MANKTQQKVAEAAHNIPVHVRTLGKRAQASFTQQRTVSSAFIDTVKWLLNWVAVNILPLVALAALLSLAVLGAFDVIGNKLQHDQRLLVSIVSVGSFAALAFSVRSKANN